MGDDLPFHAPVQDTVHHRDNAGVHRVPAERLRTQLRQRDHRPHIRRTLHRGHRSRRGIPHRHPDPSALSVRPRGDVHPQLRDGGCCPEGSQRHAFRTEPQAVASADGLLRQLRQGGCHQPFHQRFRYRRVGTQPQHIRVPSRDIRPDPLYGDDVHHQRQAGDSIHSSCPDRIRGMLHGYEIHTEVLPCPAEEHRFHVRAHIRDLLVPQSRPVLFRGGDQQEEVRRHQRESAFQRIPFRDHDGTPSRVHAVLGEHRVRPRVHRGIGDGHTGRDHDRYGSGLHPVREDVHGPPRYDLRFAGQPSGRWCGCGEDFRVPGSRGDARRPRERPPRGRRGIGGVR